MEHSTSWAAHLSLRWSRKFFAFYEARKFVTLLGTDHRTMWVKVTFLLGRKQYFPEFQLNAEGPAIIWPIMVGWSLHSPFCIAARGGGCSGPRYSVIHWSRVLFQCIAVNIEVLLRRIKEGPGKVLLECTAGHIGFLLTVFKGGTGNSVLRLADTHLAEQTCYLRVEVLLAKLKTQYPEWYVFSVRVYCEDCCCGIYSLTCA